MRVLHSSGASFVQGKASEQAKLLKWIELANCEIMVNECEENEISYTVVSKRLYTTQKERQEDFQYAKKKL
jgi:hypothetical protein